MCPHHIIFLSAETSPDFAPTTTLKAFAPLETQHYSWTYTCIWQIILHSFLLLPIWKTLNARKACPTMSGPGWGCFKTRWCNSKALSQFSFTPMHVDNDRLHDLLHQNDHLVLEIQYRPPFHKTVEPIRDHLIPSLCDYQRGTSPWHPVIFRMSDESSIQKLPWRAYCLHIPCIFLFCAFPNLSFGIQCCNIWILCRGCTSRSLYFLICLLGKLNNVLVSSVFNINI